MPFFPESLWSLGSAANHSHDEDSLHPLLRFPACLSHHIPDTAFLPWRYPNRAPSILSLPSRPTSRAESVPDTEPEGGSAAASPSRRSEKIHLLTRIHTPSIRTRPRNAPFPSCPLQRAAAQQSSQPSHSRAAHDPSASQSISPPKKKEGEI